MPDSSLRNIGVLNVSGLNFALTIALVHLGAGNVGLLLVLSGAIAIVLGMGMPTVGVYVLLAALVAPALTEVGIQPIAAHLFVLYFGMMSMTTPPVAVAAFAAASIAQSDPIRTGFSVHQLDGSISPWSAFGVTNSESVGSQFLSLLRLKVRSEINRVGVHRSHISLRSAASQQETCCQWETCSTANNY